MRKQPSIRPLLPGLAAIAALALLGCEKQVARKAAPGIAGDAAERVYVAPGTHDELYGFFSGGFSGQLSVVGLPSGRTLRVIPVFSQNPENGYGFSEETKALLNTSFGFVPWDDAHHPELSQTNGEADGRFIFINGNNTPRIARIDLRTFETVETIEIPNSAGNHSSPFTTENSEYLVAGTRFSVPIPQASMTIKDFKKEFKGAISFISVDKVSGRMAVAFQVLMPGYDYDKAHCGKGPSKDWAFFTTYDTEQAHTLLEVNASQRDKDYIAAINWKKAEACVAAGKGHEVAGLHYDNYLDEKTQTAVSEVRKTTKMITPAECPDMVYYLPTPKSPHGVDVDPTGEYIVGAGKLASLIPVHSFSKMIKAIAAKAYDGEAGGIPVLKYDQVIAGEVDKPGLGPLHTEFDGKGFAYTSMFLSSEIVKWKLGTWEIVDRIPCYYAIGHLMIPLGDTKKPYGKYVIALNKITKDRYLPTGPELTQSSQIIDISGEKMRLLAEFPTNGEPHYAQAIPANMVEPNSVKIYKLEDNHHPDAIHSEKEARVVRQGKALHIYASVIRSHFVPDNIEGAQLGDTLYFHVTNLEQDWDVPHGFAMMGAQTAELLVMPGQTRTLKIVANRAGVIPFYCTDFCSALHQEMQGYIRVSPPGEKVDLTWSTGKEDAPGT
ncbi:MAG: Sec-dependent nitrous-oxide reductase [Fibrobacteres bacterium]|nr:Sec-dependent nitrous-oxide reductase [Fibrobacterota bacterium]